MKDKKILKTIIVFLSVFLASAGLSLLLRVNNGVMPSVMIGAATALWYYNFYKKETD